MFDIDNFKDINDSMGHLTGDLTLQHIAKLTLANIRNTDYLIRFGGDEFIIILPETRRDDAVEVAEKLRKLICNDEQLKQFKTDISISCGVTEYTRGETSEQLIEKTDKVLYKAKKTGRNKVSI